MVNATTNSTNTHKEIPMSKDTKQRTVSDIEANAQSGGSAKSTLTDTRTEIDRLFAVASKSFEAMMAEGKSDEFLKASQQTGGQ